MGQLRHFPQTQATLLSAPGYCGVSAGGDAAWEILDPDSWTPAGYQRKKQKEIEALLASGQARVLAPGERPPEPTRNQWIDYAAEKTDDAIAMWAGSKLAEPLLGLGSRALGIGTAAGEEAGLGKAASEGVRPVSAPVADETVGARPATAAPKADSTVSSTTDEASEAGAAAPTATAEASGASSVAEPVDGEANGATSTVAPVDDPAAGRGSASTATPAPAGVGGTAFSQSFSRIMDALPESELAGRAPELHREALQAIFDGHPNLRFLTPDGIREAHPAEFFAQPPEVRQALAFNVIDPTTGRTLGEEYGLDMFQREADGGGAAKPADVPTQSAPEVAATPGGGQAAEV